MLTTIPYKMCRDPRPQPGATTDLSAPPASSRAAKAHWRQPVAIARNPSAVARRTLGTHVRVASPSLLLLSRVKREASEKSRLAAVVFLHGSNGQSSGAGDCYSPAASSASASAAAARATAA